MSLDGVNRRPARMTLANIRTGATVEAQFNPAAFTEALQVSYARQSVVGLSHQVLQYSNTGNVGIPLTLFFDALQEDYTPGFIESAKSFLQHLCYPRRGGGGPPRVLLVWPNVLSLVTVITGLALNHTRFNINGAVTTLEARVTLEEIRDVKLFSEDALVVGSFRSGSAQGST